MVEGLKEANPVWALASWSRPLEEVLISLWPFGLGFPVELESYDFDSLFLWTHNPLLFFLFSRNQMPLIWGNPVHCFLFQSRIGSWISTRRWNFETAEEKRFAPERRATLGRWTELCVPVLGLQDAACHYCVFFVYVWLPKVMDNIWSNYLWAWLQMDVKSAASGVEKWLSLY